MTNQINLTLSKAIEGFFLAKEIAGMSKHTVGSYKLTLTRLEKFLDGKPADLRQITADDLRRFIKQMQTTGFHQKDGVAPKMAKKPSPKTINNAHVCLSSFWTWAVAEGYADENITKKVKPHKITEPAIEPFTKDEEKLLVHEAGNNLRDRALLLFLTDTGVRSSELCDLTLKNLDLKGQKAKVKGKSRMDGGQNKERFVYLGKRATKAVWSYLAKRGELKDEDYVFVTASGDDQLDRRHLAKHLKRLGDRTGVKGVYPHRFRHTFAIQFLRNGGDVFTLQALLGHESLDIVKRYVRIANIDCETTHRRASPVDNWRL